MQTPNAIVVTHHDKHLPLHRWQIGAKHTKLDYAVNCLQQGVLWGFYHWMVETLPRLAAARAEAGAPYLISDKPFVKELIKALGIEDKVVYTGVRGRLHDRPRGGRGLGARGSLPILSELRVPRPQGLPRAGRV